jgi:MEMO1 family protein
MVRQPSVAGKFYTNDPDQLREELDSFVSRGVAQRAIGIIAPHAGYIYSGKVAGNVYGAVKVPDTVVVIGPNHTGMGAPAALSPAREWLTPLGPVPVNSRLCKLILKHAPQVREDAAAHHYEHSLEVQLPFLQYINANVSIVPLCLGQVEYDSLATLGAGIAAAIKEFGEDVLIVASSDMTHYESAVSAKAKDDQALAQVTAMNPEGLLGTCLKKGITMCGVAPATVMLVAAKALGATSSRVISYANSGEVNGDMERVVGYAAVMVS